MSKLNKDEASIVRAIKSIKKATDGLSPSQKKRSCEAIISEVGDELFLSFSVFSAIANESYSSIQERAEQEELEKSEALSVIMEAAKATDAFGKSKMSPEEFLSSLLLQDTSKKTKKKPSRPQKTTSNEMEQSSETEANHQEHQQYEAPNPTDSNHHPYNQGSH